MSIILGIDPGKDGAGVVLDGDRVAYVWRTTDTTIPSGKGSKRLYCPHRMLAVLQGAREHGALVAVLERAQPRPGEGTVSAYTSGEGRGLWLGLLTSLGFELVQPHPATWTKVMLRDVPGEGKARAILVAEGCAGLELRRGRERLAHEGIADAYCLARYGQRTR